MATIKGKLVKQVAPKPQYSSNKITIFGGGKVGMACCVSLLTQNITCHVALIDKDEKKIKGEVMDLEYGSSIIDNPRIEGSSDYAVSEGSRVCIITAGARQKNSETQIEQIQRNTVILKHCIPKLLHYSPNTILLIVTNPVDIMSYIAWKISGLPKNHVVGSGTYVDTSRFRFHIAELLGISPMSCHGWIIGEHGPTAVPVWSSVNIAGTRLGDINPHIGVDSTEQDCKCWNSEERDNWAAIHSKVLGAAQNIISLKGYTSWGIGLCAAGITKVMLNDINSVVAVSTLAKGYHGIDKDIFLSLPCILNSNGVTSVIKQTLLPEELQRLQYSAQTLSECLVEALGSEMDWIPLPPDHSPNPEMFA